MFIVCHSVIIIIGPLLWLTIALQHAPYPPPHNSHLRHGRGGPTYTALPIPYPWHFERKFQTEGGVARQPPLVSEN